MSKKSYAKIIIDLNILCPAAIKKNIEIYLDKNVSEDVIDNILIKVIEKMSIRSEIKELASEFEKFFTESELKAIIKYMKFYTLNSKPKVIEFYRELIECIQNETKKYMKDDGRKR